MPVDLRALGRRPPLMTTTTLVARAVLLDTDALLWWQAGSDRLPSRACTGWAARPRR